MVPVVEGDTVDTLSARILEEEHQLYPEAVALVLSK
jgi:phosphoribosylglycinamide formyltransferase-1